MSSVMPKFSVILAAAGTSSRFKDPHYKKTFARLGEKAVWLHSAEQFLRRDDVEQLIIAIAPKDRESFTDQFGPNLLVMDIDVVDGGAERADSVRKALAKVNPSCDYVVIHDAARPCLTADWIDQVFAAAVKTGAAILASPVTSTLKRVARGVVEATVDRQNLWAAQTPQVFRKSVLLSAIEANQTAKPTDEAQLLEQAGHPVTIVPCSEMNIKLTTKSDLRLAEAILRALPSPKLDAPLHPFADDNLWR